MIRDVEITRIWYGRFYTAGDMVKAGTMDCRGCSSCCRTMTDTIFLDPWDVFHLSRATGLTFDQMMEKLYYRCAQEVFSQITSVLMGQKIAQPMKHAGNVLIALLAAMLINFIIVSRKARLRAAQNAEFLSASKQNYLRFANPRGKLVNTTRKYSPQSRGGGFIGGGGSGGGGGGGGGGFSGGGGSHGF